jgi:hypothetical protein
MVAKPNTTTKKKPLKKRKTLKKATRSKKWIISFASAC